LLRIGLEGKFNFGGFPMPFCANCGAQVEGQFCGKCGSAVAASAGTGSQQAAAPVMAPAADAMADNVASALCYVLGLVTGIIFLVIRPYNQNRTVRFHAFQAIFVHIGAIVVMIVGNIVLGMMHLWMLEPLIGLAFLLLWVFLLVKAWQGSKVVLPVVGQLAEQQA
jgi:uncharacterized membrane protein